MKKKFLFILIVLTALFVCIGLAACGKKSDGNGDPTVERPGGEQKPEAGDGEEDETEVGTEGLQYQKRKNGQGKEYFAVAGFGSSEEIEIVIPASHDGLPVKEIGDAAYPQSEIMRLIGLGIQQKIKKIY